VLEPHPHLPLLATSGLDSDVKLWMPTASQPANMSTLQRASGTSLVLHTYTHTLAHGKVLSDWPLGSSKQLKSSTFQ